MSGRDRSRTTTMDAATGIGQARRGLERSSARFSSDDATNPAPCLGVPSVPAVGFCGTAPTCCRTRPRAQGGLRWRRNPPPTASGRRRPRRRRPRPRQRRPRRRRRPLRGRQRRRQARRRRPLPRPPAGRRHPPPERRRRNRLPRPTARPRLPFAMRHGSPRRRLKPRPPRAPIGSTPAWRSRRMRPERLQSVEPSSPREPAT